MCGNLIFIVFALIGLVFIDNLSFLLSAVICGFLIYLYIFIFWTSTNKNQYIVPLIVKIWDGMSLIFRLWQCIISVFFTLCHSKKILQSMKISYTDHCTEVLSVENEIDSIVLKVSEYYLHSWFDDVSEEAEFILKMNDVIKTTLIRLCNKINKVNHKKFLHTVLQLYLHFFTHFIQDKKKPEMNCKTFEMKHWASQDKMTEWCYFQSLLSSLINKFGPTNLEDSVHIKQSTIIHNFIVEILSEHVLCPLTKMFTNPSQLNSWLLRILKPDAVVDIDNKYMSADFQNPPSDCLLLNSSAGPEILLSEESLDETQIFGNKNSPKHEIPMSKEFYINDPYECRVINTSSASNYFDSVDSNSLSPFTPYLKSSSNINLYDSEIFNLREKNIYCSSVFTDIPVIKRSKSADYIQQVPHLRAIKIKDYSSISKDDKKTFLTFIPDLTTGNCIEQAEEAIEVPKLFSNIRISDTCQHSEAGVPPYTLYCIKYLGIFHDTAHLTDKLQFIKQEVTIKRRFREFLALQSRLEENNSLKTWLRGIKGPSKWLALPFSNMDKKNIAERKSFLENYLKELCNQAPIAHSAEFQEFLAYGGDASLAFEKKGTDINVPRIDKILVRGVKGAIDMFKTALPNLPPTEVGCMSEASAKMGCEDLILDKKFPEHLLQYSSREPEIRRDLKYCLKTISTVNRLDNFETEVDPQRASMLRNMFPVKVGSTCQCSGTWEYNDESLHEEHPLGNCVVDILIECLKTMNYKSLHLFSLLKLLISPRIERFLIYIIDGFTEQHLAMLLHLLHKALWPKEVSQSQNVTGNTNHSSSFNKLKQCLEDVIKTTNVILVPSCLEVIYLVLSSIQHEQLNRCLVFYFYDVIAECLC